MTRTDRPFVVVVLVALIAACAAVLGPGVDPSALVGLAGLRGGAVPVADVAGWEPVYGRPAEAQAQWERTHGRPLSGAAGLAG